MREHYVTELLTTTHALLHSDEKKHADLLWEVVTRTNIETIKKIRKDDFMCKALAEIMKPEINEAFDNGFNNGHIDGQIEAKAESIIECLKELGPVPDEIQKKIQKETDLEKLRKWFKCALKAESIEDFMGRIGHEKTDIRMVKSNS